jgi:4-carboxymuconolactone decarboxylase
MTMTNTRIAPLERAPEGQLQLNIFRTLAKHERLLEHFSRFGGFLLGRGLLPAREREIVILRVGYRCGSVYEFGQHTLFGRSAGLSDEEIRRLAQDDNEAWQDEHDRDLVRFADEICATNNVSDETWQRLAQRWSEPELLELVVLAGMYRLVSGLLNTVGVELDPGVPGWPQ